MQNGIITEVRYSKTFGNMLRFKTEDNYEIMFAHLKDILVAVNDTVYIGQIVALSGNTGLSSGPHLHYSIRKNGELVDPINYITLPTQIE